MAENATHFAQIECLEQRRLLSGPQLIGEQLLGTLPLGTTGVVLTFAGPLDPISAENVKAYHIYRTDTESGFGGFGVFSIGATDDETIRNEVVFSSAVYDPTTFSVT